MNDISTMIKIMEYIALGKPIVQFDSREGKFSAQDAALYTDTRNQVADSAAKIICLIDNPDERKRMGEFGRARVERELAWEYSVQNLLAAYERAFSKKLCRCDKLYTTADRANLELSAQHGVTHPKYPTKVDEVDYRTSEIPFAQQTSCCGKSRISAREDHVDRL